MKNSNIKDPDKRKSQIFMAGSVSSKKRFLKKQKKSFVLEKTNRTSKIKYEGTKYTYGCGLGFKKERLTLNTRLKKEVKDSISFLNTTPLDTLQLSSIKYYHFNQSVFDMGNGELIDKCTSFDINMAYYRCAFNKGYISESFYKECLDLDKPTRLSLIGSIATKKRIYTYSEGKLVDQDDIQNEKMRNVWFRIVKEVDDCMYELSCELGNNFIFYWVDGIYVRGSYAENIQTIERVFNKYNFDFKNESVDNIVMTINNDNTKTLNVFKADMREKRNKKGELRNYKPFTLPDNKRAKLKPNEYTDTNIG